MTFYVTNQNTVIVMLVGAGLVFGFLRGILKVKRYFIKGTPLIMFVEDLLYCAMCAFLFHILIFITNYGYIRWYEFASCFTGMALYGFLFEKAVMKVFVGIINFIRVIVLRIFGMVMLPFVKIFGLIKRFALKYVLKVFEYIQVKKMKFYSDSNIKKTLRLAENGFYRI